MTRKEGTVLLIVYLAALALSFFLNSCSPKHLPKHSHDIQDRQNRKG